MNDGHAANSANAVMRSARPTLRHPWWLRALNNPPEVVVFDRPEGWSNKRDEAGLPCILLSWVGGVVGIGPSNDHALTKRAIARLGQTVQCCDVAGRVVADGEGIDDACLGSDFPFVSGALDCGSTPQPQRCFAPLTLPDSCYLALGDSRAASIASIPPRRGRNTGSSLDCVRVATRTDIVGSVLAVALPPDRWRQTLAPTATFGGE